MELEVLDGWCAQHLSAGVHKVLFRGGYFSEVVGVELSDNQWWSRHAPPLTG